MKHVMKNAMRDFMKNVMKNALKNGANALDCKTKNQQHHQAQAAKAKIDPMRKAHNGHNNGHNAHNAATAPVHTEPGWHDKPVGWFKRSICVLFSVAIVNTLGLPLAHAHAAKRQQQAMQALAQPSPAERYASGFDAIEAALAASAAGRGSAGAIPFGISDAAAPYTSVLESMNREADHLRHEWQELRAAWQDAQVGSSILAQQQSIETTFEQHHRQLEQLLQAVIKQPQNATALQALRQFVEQHRPQRSHLPINLDNMPWQVEQPKPVMPAATAQELEAKLLATGPAQPSSGTTNSKTGNKADGKTGQGNQTAPATPSASSKPLITYRLALDVEDEARNSQPAAPIAKAGQPYSIAADSKAASAPAAADLAPTLDAPHTDAIKALAASLGNNPHRIYQWVHDNIHYFPSHGSVQGAQDTLDKKRGNAFDTASLLIALLRSAGIASRYVYGSVEIPVEKVQNWVGNAATAEAAQQILSQGGVPNVLLTRGGKAFAIRLEHIWVEALIQYQPGRGARHIPGQSQPDAWVPLDGSYKQYTYSQGMDLQSAVPIDADALLAAASQGAQINEAEGWARNLNSAAIDAQLKSYQNRLQAHINSQNNGNSTVGDILGAKQAQIDPLPYLAGTLPYTIKARSQQYSQIPAHQRAHFKYEIYADPRSAAWGESPQLSWQAPTAELAGKKITIAWVAASEADQRAIEALIPTPAAGQELDPSQLPRGLSSSIRLKPEIRVDGQTVATGSAYKAGDEPIGAGSYTKYGSQEWDTTTDQLIAGQQTALGLSIQGISQAQLEQLKTRMEQTQAKLQQAQNAPQNQREQILQGITGEHLTGDMLTATIWGYLASLQSYGAIAGSQAQIIDLPGLQYGLFHAQVQPNKLYGIVTTGISFKGLNMDVGHIRSIRWVQDDNPDSAINSDPNLTQNGKTAAQNRWIAYNKAKGQYSSAMEHAIPEELWVDKSQCRYTDGNGQTQNPNLNNCAEGISAVKAIAIAQAQGQKIYTINESNRATALPTLSIGGEAGAEIRNAIAAGKEVTFHENQINAHGWTGYGYIIVDPETGAGGYIIDGKGNGGWLDAALEWVKDNPGLATVASLILGLAATPVGGFLGGLMLIASLVLSAMMLYNDLIAFLEGDCAGLAVLFVAISIVIFAFAISAGGFVGLAIAMAFAGYLWPSFHEGLMDGLRKTPLC